MDNFATPSYEHLELSTQLVIKEALSRNLEVDVLDADEQFIRISDGTRTEYIKEATMTSADSYVVSKILDNKAVQKTILEEKDIRVPKGKKHTEAPSFADHAEGKWVIKPTTTNFGIGITIAPETETDFNNALKEAFKHDNTIIVEEFIPGIECRFLVIDGKCVAVLHRVPANVVGDGTKTISELIDEKNAHAWRGKGYKTPLEFLQKGETEKQILAEQNLTLESVPQKDEQIFIRKNSNISTGGDSIDYTDEVHEAYKEIAVKAAEAVDAKICGIDMMMSDHTNPPTNDNHAIIELNRNPVLYFHDFPFKGDNRHVAKRVLDVIGF